ncbi:unnamed protein product, partial [Ectocarpus fasciculatus]
EIYESFVLPRLIAFDLDGTIWSPDMYMLWGGGAPFTAVEGEGGVHTLTDVSGQKVMLLGMSGQILDDLRHHPRWEHTVCALVSCTDEPAWADECLDRFSTTPSGLPLRACVDNSQIFKSNKKTHFQRLRAAYPHIDYSEMLFFDNEMSNIRSVSSLGVCCLHCPDGMTEEAWVRGLCDYANRRA